MKKIYLFSKKNKVLYLLFFSYLFSLSALGQTPTFSWAGQMGGTTADYGKSIAVDASGNVYSCGQYNGTSDFDPGPGVSSVSGVGSYISKLDASGNLIWIYTIPGTCYAYALALNPTGTAVHMTGSFNSPGMDFNAGAGVNTLINNSGGKNIFVLKVSSAGTFSWVKQFVDGACCQDDEGLAIAVDASGNVYTTGYFNGTADFDPGAGTANLTSSGAGDVFISKLSSAGGYVWAKYFRGTGGADYGQGIAVDASGNVYTTGSFISSDFDPGAGVYTLTSAGSTDIFVASLNSLGNFVWAYRVGSTGSDQGLSIALDASSNVYTTGNFELSVDFDPGVGSTSFTSLGFTDIFVSKSNSSGTFLWAKKLGGVNYDFGRGINIDVAGNVLTTGEFVGTVDFDPGATVYNLSSPASTSDAFVSKLNSSGNFISAVITSGAFIAVGNSIGTDASGNIYITGDFWQTTDFDPSASIYNQTSFGSSDIFVEKFSDCALAPATPASISGATTICSGTTNTYSITAVSGATFYTWVLPGGWTGTSTTNSINATASTASGDITVTANNACGNSTAQTLAIVVNTIPTTPGTISGTATICSGTTNTYSIAAVAGATSYTWSLPGGWSGTSTINSINATAGATSGNVTVAATNACGTSASQTLSVTVNTTPATPGAISGLASMCVGAGASNYNVASVAGATSYTWSLPGGWSGSSSTNIISATPGTTGIFTITASNSCGTSSQSTLNVTVNSLPTITVNSGSICSGSSFTIVPSGASTYTYSSGSAIVSPTTTTSYSVTGTSAAGCVSTSPAISNLTVNAKPTIAVNSGSICSGNSFTMVPSGASTYTYSGGSAIVSPTTTISYSVTGTSAQGCVGANTAVSNVTVNTLPTISVNSGAICSGSSFTIVPSGASTYTYSGGSAVVSPTTSSSYSVTGTSTAGCASANTAVSNVTVNTHPTIAVNSGSICSGSSFTIVPSGASTYTYSGGSAVVSPTTSSSYSVTGTSTAGCSSANTAVSNITVNATPSISVNSGAICSGNSFTMVPTGASTYTYSGGSAVVSPTTTSSYSVTGTSAQGCVSASSAVSTVTVNATPTIAVNSGAICPGNSFTLSPSGASTYTFSNGPVVTPTTTSGYSVTGTSAAGCVSAGPAVSTVTVANTLTVTISGSSTVCNGTAVNLTAGGATSYTWNTGATTGAIAPTPSINTTYSVTGASGSCSNTAVFSVTVNALPSVTVNSGVICSGQSFTIVPSGASTYTYTGGSSVVSPITTTSYSVTGTDAQGCVSPNAISNVTVNPLPTIGANTTNTLMCTGESATLTANGASTYTWSPGGSGISIVVSPTVTSTYTINGIDGNGCSNSTIFTQSVSLCTGLSPVIVSTQESISVYPNPFNSKLIIVSHIKDQNAQIFNALGSLVHEIIIENETTEIDLSSQPKGIYFIRIGSVKKVIIKE